MNEAELQGLTDRVGRLERDAWRWRWLASALSFLFLLLGLLAVYVLADRHAAVERERVAAERAREGERQAKVEETLARRAHAESERERMTAEGLLRLAQREVYQRIVDEESRRRQTRGKAPPHMPRAQD